MELISVIILAIGLAMDAFAVSICKGLAMGRPDIRSMLTVGIWFGAFQAIMPIIGFYFGASIHDYVAGFDYVIAFLLLEIIGLNMIREALSDEENEQVDSIGFKIMLILAIATSIDAFAAGISLAMDGSEIFAPALIIGVITMLISMLGVRIGNAVGEKFSSKAEILGGIILMVLGLKILAEGLGLL